MRYVGCQKEIFLLQFQTAHECAGIERANAYIVNPFPAYLAVVNIQNRVQIGALKIYAIVANIDSGGFFCIAGFAVGASNFVYPAVQGRGGEKVLYEVNLFDGCGICRRESRPSFQQCLYSGSLSGFVYDFVTGSLQCALHIFLGW